MRLSRLASALAITFGLLAEVPAAPPPADPASAAQSVTVVGAKTASRWSRAESEHIVVYSDAAEDDIAALLNNLEKLDRLLRGYSGLAPARSGPEAKLTLLYQADAADLRRIDAGLSLRAVGLYSSCAAGVRGAAVHAGRIAPLGDAQLEKAALDETLSYAFEAYARHFVYRHTDLRTPTSFIEGFAQYFSSVRFSDRQMVVGRVPAGIGRYLRYLDDGHMYSLDYPDVLQHDLAHAHNVAGDDGVRLEFEAKSWLLTHYMLSSADQRRRMNRYLDLAGAGLPVSQAFEQAFAIKASDLGDVIWRYRRRGIEMLRVEFAAPAASRIRLQSVSHANGEFVVADAALKSCPGRQAGEALRERLAAQVAQYPDSTLGRLAWSRAEIEWGQADKAVVPLEAVLKDDESHAEAWLLLGLAKLRLAQGQHGDGGRALIEAAQRHLQRALALDPRSPDAAYAAFRAALAAPGEPSAATLQQVIPAWQGARELGTLGRAAALAYAYTGDADKAAQVLDVLAQDERDGRMAKWAGQWRARLDTGVTRDDILAEMRLEPAPAEPLKEWTMDKAAVMMAVARNQGVKDAASALKDMARSNPASQQNGIGNDQQARGPGR